MAEIVNLRLVRKARRRLDEERQAAVNRAAFGRSKVEKAAERARTEQQAHALDQARRERPDASNEETP